MGHSSHHPALYDPQTDAEYNEQQRRDTAVMAEGVCSLCEASRARLPLRCQCGERAGTHAIRHPHPYRMVGCTAFTARDACPANSPPSTSALGTVPADGGSAHPWSVAAPE